MVRAYATFSLDLADEKGLPGCPMFARRIIEIHGKNTVSSCCGSIAA